MTDKKWSLDFCEQLIGQKGWHEKIPRGQRFSSYMYLPQLSYENELPQKNRKVNYGI